MLILSRVGGTLKIGGNTAAVVLNMRDRQIQIGVTAPKAVPAQRKAAFECGAAAPTLGIVFAIRTRSCLCPHAPQGGHFGGVLPPFSL